MTATRWVIPDIHGYAETLKALLAQIQPNIQDHLIFLGDYIDRGPDAKGVIDEIMRLQAEGYKVTALRGNHEQFLLDTYRFAKNNPGFWKTTKRKAQRKEWFRHGGKETLASFGVKDVMYVPEKYIQWIETLPYYHCFDDYVIVHAGLNFKIDNVFDDTHSMLWLKEFDVEPKKIQNRQLIHGHTPVHLELIHHYIGEEDQSFLDLDNGVYMTQKQGFGNLLAFNLDTRMLVAQYAIDKG